MNIIKKLKTMKDALPKNYHIDEERSLETENVYARTIVGLSPPLIWRDNKWKSTELN